ncbi:MAG: hypothetical protein PHY99_00855 [Bacteroidales bacterium]|nr:hypothetical protein [Bacteroidales bacterium]
MVGCWLATKTTKTYQFRGENRDGIFHETGLLKQWPAEGPTLL